MLRALALCSAVLALAAAPAGAQSFKKAIWGPAGFNGQDQFPTYRQLGVGVYETGLEWDNVAPTRPANPRDPNDPAYRWPSTVDQAVAGALGNHMDVSVTLTRAPEWASGHVDGAWAPRNPADYADFATAAARHYRGVRYWLIWGEPTRLGNFKPLPANAPRIYAQMLDAAYVALKRANRSNIVVGGDTFTVGVISPTRWLQLLKLPNGKRPRMDMWGHNPFTRRKPDLSGDPLIGGYVDFGTLDEFARELDHYYPRKHLRYFLSEFTVPTGHQNWLFNFFESEQTAANWLTAALRVARHWNRIAVLGWYQLYDEAPRPDGRETLYGLIARDGRRKPAFRAFEDG